ncbi:MAG: B-box zinc finger protein [Granulicella sp.]
MNCANHPDRERVAFCQNCGKPLCSECSRTVGNAVFCEPCLAARLAAAEAAAPTGAPFSNVNAPYPTPPLAGTPNPALAGLLGLIPGVGAMYNGQYAKGFVHLLIFIILVSLSDTNSIFGMFVAGWVFYQVIEAYQTAAARRDGRSLPNPFGLNDIGERLGFGKSWSGPGVSPAAPAAYDPGAPASTPGSIPYANSVPYTGGAPFMPSAADTQAYDNPAAYTQNWSNVPPVGSYAYGAPPNPPVSPYYGNSYPGADPLALSNRRPFPTGALILIGFGLLFFLGSSGIFHGFPIQRLLPFFLIGVGVWVFISRMTRSGLGVTDDGSPDYRMRLFQAVRGSVWLVLIGVLFFLDTFNILSWGHSWPLIIILFGLLWVFKSSAQGYAQPYPYPPAGPATPYPPAAPVGTEIEHVTTNDEEGR